MVFYVLLSCMNHKEIYDVLLIIVIFCLLQAVVTGAGGRTGRLVLERLASKSDIEARGLVRTDEAKAALGNAPNIWVVSSCVCNTQSITCTQPMMNGPHTCTCAG